MYSIKSVILNSTRYVQCSTCLNNIDNIALSIIDLTRLQFVCIYILNINRNCYFETLISVKNTYYNRSGIVVITIC